jgi:hypothetical protein
MRDRLRIEPGHTTGEPPGASREQLRSGIPYPLEWLRHAVCYSDGASSPRPETPATGRNSNRAIPLG